MAKKSNNKPQWDFPPRNGGIDFIHDPSAAFFNDNPIPKLVREVIQNSLDASEPDIVEPVCVTFADIRVDRKAIGAAQLYKHLKSCHDRAREEERKDSICELYERALNTLKNSHVRCLRITDTNTTGLSGSRWDALVIQEGSVQKSDMGAPGGAFGVGKNAVFNVSDIHTVFYSTHYIDIENRKGRVDKLQGKATLMSHPNPLCPEESLQHIGFYRDDSGQPITGRRRIDTFFHLPEPGTGVFVMGFNPRTDDWVDEIVQAVLQNFFFAVHHQRLVVKIENGDDVTTITHEDLEPLYESYGESASDGRFYYNAIRDVEPEVTKPISQLGPLDVYINLNGGPKRMAFVNRNGMLITDSREKKDNPIPPNNRSLWPDYAAVIIPSTDSGDRLIREMENPSHDAVSVTQLPDRDKQRKMRSAFMSARDAIRAIMDDKTHLAQSGNQANLRELAELFPELDPSKEGVVSLLTREIVSRSNSQDSFVESDSDDGNVDGEEVDADNEGENTGETENGNTNGHGESEEEGEPKGPATGPGGYGTRGSRVPVSGVRVMTTGERTALVVFTPVGRVPHEVRFSLKAAGEEYQKVERIHIASASLREPKVGQRVAVDDNVVTLFSKDTERATIEIETSESVANVAFKLGVLR